MWYGQHMMWYTLLYEMIMFCRSCRQPTGALWLSLYCMKCKCHVIFFTLSLRGSDSCRSNSWRDDNDATMEIKVSRRWRWWSWWCCRDGDHEAQDDDDHIISLILICMWCLSFYASYLALIDGSIIRWSLTKLSRSVLPEYAPLPKFVVPRHHVMIGCDKLYVHLQRVQASFAHAEYSG